MKYLVTFVIIIAALLAWIIFIRPWILVPPVSFYLS